MRCSPGSFYRFETLCVGSANFFLSIEQKQRSIVFLRSRGFFCHFRSINYRSIRLSLYSLSFSPLYFPLYFSPSPLSLLPPLFFFFISNVQRTAFVRRGRKGGEKKKTRGTKRERAESFRFVERIASLFSIGRKCRIEVEFRLKRFHGVESCLADFYISRFPLVARATRGIDISRVCTICRRVKRY